MELLDFFFFFQLSAENNFCIYSFLVDFGASSLERVVMTMYIPTTFDVAWL